MLKHVEDCQCGRCVLARLKLEYDGLSPEEMAAVKDALVEAAADRWEEEEI